MSRLVVSDVCKAYTGKNTTDSVVALQNVTFTVAHNEFCSILGHSGCGKTTLLNMIAGFERLTSGKLLLDETPVGKPGWERAVIFQDYALFPWMTVYENIAFGLEMKKVPLKERTYVTEQHVQLVGLAGFEKRYPHELSGGMRQRVAIARALAVDPHVLLMDEPFAALDAQNRAMMQNEMIRIWETERKTVIFVTHSIEEAIKLSDRIIVMTCRPGHVKENIVVDLPRPRHEEDPAVTTLKRRIRSLINKELEDESCTAKKNGL
ncbi:MAG: ABC transporter ATP-binding protein [Nitrospirae bacterium]|nr:ABC transporter ATP-binding protein [Nitrospirota bacterium]